jgi:hypothetical protein
LASLAGGASGQGALFFWLLFFWASKRKVTKKKLIPVGRKESGSDRNMMEFSELHREKLNSFQKISVKKNLFCIEIHACQQWLAIAFYSPFFIHSCAYLALHFMGC